MSSRSSSSRSKSGSSSFLRVSMGGSSKKGGKSEKTEEEDIVDLSDGEDTEENGVDSQSGTEVEVLDSDEDSAEEAPKKARVSLTNKAAFSMPDEIAKLMNRVLCCSCGKQLNPMNEGAVRKHPWLKVVTCKKCYKFLKSGSFTRDDEGIDEQCRWCGDGGRLYGCDYCNHCFCRSCIKRNLGRSEAAIMETEEDKKWHCYLCKPKKIRKLVDDCRKILDYIAEQDKKEKAREERAKIREKEKAEAAQKRRHERRAEKKKGSDKREKESTPTPSKTSTPTPSKTTLPAPKSKDLIILDDSPAKVVLPSGSKNVLKPDVKSGVQRIQKSENGITHVTVGPKPAQQIKMPYQNIQPRPQVVHKPIMINSGQFITKGATNPQLHSMLTQQIPAGINKIQVIQGGATNTVGRGISKPNIPLNDLKALKEGIMPFTVDNIVEKMNTVSQSLNLVLNSIKTDLAIAKISNNNMFQARNSASHALKNGMEIFFNSVRQICNVQITTSSSPIEIDAKPDTNTSTATSNTSSTSTPKASKDLKKENLDISHIPIDLDDSDTTNSSKTAPKKEETDVKKEEKDVKKEETDVKKEEKDVKKDDTKKENGESTENDESCLIVSDPEEDNVDEDYVIMEVEDDEDDDENEEDKDKSKESESKKKEKKGEENGDSKKSENVDEDKSTTKKKDDSVEKDEAKKDTETDSKLDTEAMEVSDEKDSDSEKSKSDKSKNKNTGKKDSNKEENNSKVLEKDSSKSEKKEDKANKYEQNDNEAIEDDKTKDDNKSKSESKKDKKSKPEKSESSPTKKLDESENTAAELELLKEMADELNESDSESEEEAEEPRRSSRRNKSRTKSEDEDHNSDLEKDIKNLSKETKLTSRSSTRTGGKKEDKKDSEKDKKESEKDDSSSKRSSRQKKGTDESKDEENDVEENSKRSSRHKSPQKKSKSGKAASGDENEDKESDEELTSKRSSRHRSPQKHSKPTSDGKKKEKDTSEDRDNESEISSSSRRSSRNRSPTKKAKGKGESSAEESQDAEETSPKDKKSNKSSAKKSVKDESDDKDDSEEETSNKRSSRSAAKKSTVKGETSEEKETEANGTEEDDEPKHNRSSRSAGKKSAKKEESDDEKPKDKKKSAKKEESDDEKPKDKSPSKKSKKATPDDKDKSKDSKKKYDKTKDLVGDELSSGSESDDSDSDASDAEFGKKKKKFVKKAHPFSKTAAEKQQTLRDKSRRKIGAKKKSDSDDKDEESESSGYDEDLEKEIKSLAKDTKLSRRQLRAKKETEKDEKDTKKSKKDSKSKGKTDDGIEDLSSGTDEDRPPDDEDEDDDEENEEEDLSPSQLRKLRNAKAAEDEESDYVDMDQGSDDSEDSGDPEVSFPKMGKGKKGKRGAGSSDDIELSDDSDFKPKKKKKGFSDKLLKASVSDSDSEVGSKKKGKGKKGKGGKRKRAKSESELESDDEVYSDSGKKGKKRKRIKKVDSSEEEKVEEEEGESGSDDPDGTKAGKRKRIRKVMKNKKLGDETKTARKIEEERRARIEERQKEYNSYVEVEGGEEDAELPEGTERVLGEGEDKELDPADPAEDTISKILGSPKKVPVTTKCILEMDKKSKKPIIEINRTLVRKLKPHQVEACRFLFNCLVESVERSKKEDGAGCILAHCMGLGKTLSVISFIHTMLSNVKVTKMTKCLVVCPLNTVLNWVNEFEIWLDDVDFEIEVYELSRVKANFERAQMLKEWHEGGAGVMILGYDMYRNLSSGSHCKSAKQKKIFHETLCIPGPDMVICDEGHILKNDQTSLSKAMMKIKTRRRVVLTGTPLQNNLGEYHCMIDFVKPSLLGTRKEFYNRFANPITNGQCTDSSGGDVKLMKRRAHILHELLDGCVQRKDYSALTKFLPPKFEYVVSVRLSTVQMDLYSKYLELGGLNNVHDIKGHKGGRLFKDYQALMRIWTHPWVMKLDEIRQENKRPFDDDEDSFVDDSSSNGEDSFISDGSTTTDSDSSSYNTSKKSKKHKKGKGKGKKKSKKSSTSGSGSDSDSDNKKSKMDEDGNEVVKKWTSKRRGNEEGAGTSWMDVDMGYADEGPKQVTADWWAEFVKEEDENKLELSGKMMLLFEILKMCEDIGDKVLVFSQSLLSLDIIEDYLEKIDSAHQAATNAGTSEGAEKKDEKEGKDGKDDSVDKKEEEKVNGETTEGGEKTVVKVGGDGRTDEQKKIDDKFAHYGKSWTKGADYFRMDGSTSSIHRKTSQDMFNDPANYRARLFLISTKAGSLGINLVSANRVIIFDASWNPSHDIQSIFRVYRFGQVKPVYVYRFLAQGTMEEKIYERQVTKQSLSQRVVDEHQIERHFTSKDLQELYNFQPDRLDDPNRKERLPMLPKDHMLAELMTSKKEWIVTFHEHDSLLENVVDQELSEEEKKAAWEDYEQEKKGIVKNTGMMMGGNTSMFANPNLSLQNLMLHGQANLGQQAVLQIVQDLKARFPTLPPEVFQQRVQAVLRQVLTNQIMQQSDMQRRQLDQQKMNELNRLNQIKQQIQRQQAMISNQQRGLGMAGQGFPIINSAGAMGMNSQMAGVQNLSMPNTGRQMGSLLTMNQQLQNARNAAPAARNSSSPTLQQQLQNARNADPAARNSSSPTLQQQLQKK